MTKQYEIASGRSKTSSLSAQVDYYIQIAASRTQLTGHERDVVYNICPSCREVIESGWFKYQYYSGTSYDEALNRKNDFPVKAFIIAYRGGTKLYLHK